MVPTSCAVRYGAGAPARSRARPPLRRNGRRSSCGRSAARARSRPGSSRALRRVCPQAMSGSKAIVVPATENDPSSPSWTSVGAQLSRSAAGAVRSPALSYSAAAAIACPIVVVSRWPLEPASKPLDSVSPCTISTSATRETPKCSATSCAAVVWKPVPVSGEPSVAETAIGAQGERHSGAPEIAGRMFIDRDAAADMRRPSAGKRSYFNGLAAPQMPPRFAERRQIAIHNSVALPHLERIKPSLPCATISMRLSTAKATCGAPVLAYRPQGTVLV